MRTPDVNVLLYAVNRDCSQHSIAKAWMADSFARPQGIGFAWIALLGFLRIATRPGIFSKPLNVEEALAVVDVWLSRPGASILNPSERHAGVLARLLMGAGSAGNLVSDAHLAALAIEHSAELGSFDRDFERFSGLRFQLLR